MDLSYIVDQDIEKLGKLEELGCDIDSLFFIAKDALSLCDELVLNSKQASELLVRLKRAYDVSQGKVVEPDLVLYENNKNQPTRLSVENKVSGESVFFKTDLGMKEAFMCELCNEGGILKNQAKMHVAEKHYTC